MTPGKNVPSRAAVFRPPGSGIRLADVSDSRTEKRLIPPSRSALTIGSALLLASIGISSCVRGQPASDLADPGLPFGPSSVGTQSLSWAQDIQPIFNQDCFQCHGREARGNYSTADYANVMSGQRPGDAKSSLVVDCSPGGSMYQYFSGDAVTKATMVFRWMVVNNAAQTR